MMIDGDAVDSGAALLLKRSSTTFDFLKWIFPGIWSRLIKAASRHLHVLSLVITKVRPYSSQENNESLDLV